MLTVFVSYMAGDRRVGRVSEWSSTTLSPRRMGTSAVGSGGVRLGIEVS